MNRMRLIDADALSEKLCETTIFIKGAEAFQRMIKDAQTIDAVQVIRCKDCIHRYATGDVTKYYVCDFMDAQYEDNGYCHHGEREEE